MSDLDILDRLRARTQPTTHWERCADYHDTCAAIEEIERLRRSMSECDERYFQAAAECGLRNKQVEILGKRVDIAATMHHASQGEGCPICKTDTRCRTRAILEGD